MEKPLVKVEGNGFGRYGYLCKGSSSSYHPFLIKPESKSARVGGCQEGSAGPLLYLNVLPLFSLGRGMLRATFHVVSIRDSLVPSTS